MSDTRVLGADYGLDCDCTVRLKSNNRVYEILLAADAPDGSAEHGYLQRIRDNDEARSDAAFEELYDCLVHLAQPYFQSHVAPEPTLTLHDVLHRCTTRLQLRTENSRLNLFPRPDLTIVPDPPLPSCLQTKDLPAIHTYESSKITVLETLQHDRIFKVWADDNVLCAKVMRGRFDSRSLKREILCLHRLSSAKSAKPLRIPALHGIIVASDDRGSVLGFLMDYIQSRGGVDTDLAICGHDSDCWMTQIEEAIRQFHELGVVWGDAKAENIIFKFDGSNVRLDPYIIDFGGSWTDGWVDEDLAETVEGDLQGLRRIREFFSQRKLCRAPIS